MAGKKKHAAWAGLTIILLLAGLSVWLRPWARTSPRRDIDGAAASEEGGQTTLAPTGAQDEADEALNSMVNDTVDEAMRSQGVSARMALVELAFEKETQKRQAVIASLAPYSDKEAALKDEIRQAVGGAITEDRIDGLIREAAALEADFWDKGDFDDASSFDSIYRARAALELCLETDPANEAALRQLVEVLDSGWPFFLNPDQLVSARKPEASKAEKATLARNYEGYYALYYPLWKLFDAHIAAKPNATVEDLAVVADLLAIFPPESEFAASDEEVRRNNPDAARDEIWAARMKIVNEERGRVAQWALDACRRNGSDWDFYSTAFEEYLKTGMFAIPITINLTETRQDRVRYSGRRETFKGPRSREDALVPLHIAIKPRG